MRVTPPASPADALPRLRRLMLALLVLGLVGVGADLVALQHYEDSWQLVPLFLIAVALIVIVWHLADGGPATVRALRVTMGAFVLTGLLGVFLHYRANLEFQLDMDPTQSRGELFRKVIHAQAPPALAPGAMTQLGLLGLLYAVRHPALAGRRQSLTTSSGA